MSGIQIGAHPAGATRKQDISSWKKGSISKLNTREKKRYYRRLSAMQAYFTTDEPLEDISQRYRISVEILHKLAQQCLAQHEDGSPWGYRALLPGASAIQTPLPEVPVTPGEEPAVTTDTHKAALFEDVENVSTDPTPADIQEDTAVRRAIPRSTDPRTDAVQVVQEVQEESQPIDEQEVPTSDVILNEIDTDAVLPTPEAILTDTDTDTVLPAPDDLPEVVEEEDALVPAEASSSVEPEDYSYIYKRFQPPTMPETEQAKAIIPHVEMPPVATRVMDRRVSRARSSWQGRQGRQQTASRHIVLARRSVRQSWMRSNERAKRNRTRRLIAGVVVAAILIALLIPLIAGLVAYNTYTSIRSVALDGVTRLMDVKALLPVSKSDPTAVLNPQKLQQAGVDLNLAQGDFVQLQQLVQQPGIQETVQQYAPQYAGKLDMAQRLVQVGLDVTHMGNELIGVAMMGANILHGSPLSTGSTKPLLTTDDISNIEAVMTHTLYYINDIQAQMSQVTLSELPISASQQKELASVMTLLPTVRSYVLQGQGLIGLAAWLLGVGQERRFLVQTMDSAELRPGGGFTGQYGVLDIQNGRMAPFSLQDVTELDYAGNGQELGRQSPPQYRSWMNFGNWGLRDSNLSGDFPTTAQLAMGVFQDEGGGPVDGDIAFTPAVISHILDVIGPIQVPEYNETITAQNLEDKLHYYQQNFTAIAVQQQKTGTHNAATRKAFTTLLGKILLQKVEHLPVKTLLKIAQNATKDIQSRDLEIYFTNPQAEAWLVAHNYSGAMNTFTSQDGFMVVQANISISKASQYVQTSYQDNIVLDAQGGATHTLTITLNYQQTGPVYGQDTYADYIRVYAPQNAQFQWGDGFDTGQALCTPAKTGKGGTGTTGTPQPTPPGTGTPPTTGCQQYANSFPSNARYCPDGNYNLSGPNSFVPGKGFGPWPIDSLGAPTNMTSDMPGRAMWGGLTVTPKNCISTISLSWYVPNVVKHTAGQPVYSVLVQKQGGYIPSVQISVDASQLNGIKSYNYTGNLVADRAFALQLVKKKK